MKTVTFPVVDLRSVKDPTLGEDVRRSTFYVKVRDLPAGLPKDVNPRSQDVNKRVYKDVRESLEGNSDDTVGLFHLRNQGITILANKLSYDQNTNSCTLYFTEDQKSNGIVNGGHTYEIIRSVVEDANAEGVSPPNEFVKLEVITGLGSEHVSEIAGGLNTSVQVKQESVTNLSGKFNWIKDVLNQYNELISWEENGSGQIDVADIIKYMEAMNFIKYPDGTSNPTSSYSQRSKVIDSFSSDPTNYLVLKNVLIDICKLHDHIALSASEVWNDKKNGHGKFGQSAIAKKRTPKHRSIFLGNQYKTEYVLQDGAVFPILAAFRVYLQLNEDTNQAEWKVPFDRVVQAWKEVGHELMEDIWEVSGKQKINTIHRDPSVWKNVYRAVALKEVSERALV